MQKATSTRPFHGKSASKRQSPPSSSIEDSSALTAWSCCKPPSAKSLLIGPLATHIAAMSQVPCCPIVHYFCTPCKDCTQYVLRQHCMRCTRDSSCNRCCPLISRYLGLGLCHHIICKRQQHTEHNLHSTATHMLPDLCCCHGRPWS